MNKSLLALSLCPAVLPFSLLADDAVPPKPPGGSTAPAAAPSTATPAPGAPQGGPEPGSSPEERLKRMAEALNLTQEQQDKIKAIMEKTTAKVLRTCGERYDNLTEEDKNKFRELLKGVERGHRRNSYARAEGKIQGIGGASPGWLAATTTRPHRVGQPRQAADRNKRVPQKS